MGAALLTLAAAYLLWGWHCGRVHTRQLADARRALRAAAPGAESRSPAPLIVPSSPTPRRPDPLASPIPAP